MFRLGLLFVTILFFIGCTTKKEDRLLESYNKKIDYHKQLQKTEKIQLYENNETTVVLTATYLYIPNFKKDDSRDEVFIVAISFEDEEIDNIVPVFGLRDSDDIKKMREEEEENKKKNLDHSFFDDMADSLGLGANEENNNTAKTKREKEIKVSNTAVIHYGLTLNNKNPIEIKALNANDKRLKDLSFITEWGHYYLVTFEHSKSKHFKLVFNSEKYGKGTLYFAKVAKYVYTKKGF